MGKEFAYIKIMKHYEQLILNGHLKSEELLPSEEKISKEFNVSKITTKRALEELCKKNLIYRVPGKGSFVSKIIKEPLEIKEKLKTKKSTNVVALILPFAQSFGNILPMFYSITKILEENNLILSFYISQYSSKREREIILSLLKEGVAGIILYPVSSVDNIDIMYQMYLKRIPFIVVDKYYEDIMHSGVCVDNSNGGYIATKHLIELGHRKIGFVTDYNLNRASSIRDRYFGYCKAMNEHNILNYPEELVVIGETFSRKTESLTDNSLELIKCTLESLLNNASPITAIQAINDSIAIEFMETALKLGIRIPQELSIIGFDNIEASKEAKVPLTTIEQNFSKIGIEAAKLLLRLINNFNAESTKVYIPTKLIVRESTTMH